MSRVGSESAQNIKTVIGASAALLALAFACAPAGEQTPPAEPAAYPPPAPPPAMASQPPPAPGGAPAAPPTAPMPPPVVVKDVGFKTPESVLYDAENDVMYVSNINGKPTDADKNGFISKVSPDGKVLELKWIDGSKPATALNAPKGLAIAAKMLWVSDLNQIKLFDLKTGAARGRLGAPGATFLNDLTAAPDGTVYAADSGMKLGANGFEPTGTDAVFQIGKRRAVEVFFKSKDLNRPNGVLADDKGVWVTTFGAAEIFYLSKEKKLKERTKEQITKLPGGSLDGIVRLPDGSLLVTSWETSTVYQGTPGGTFQPILTGLEAPADIGYDSKRHRVLVPRFKGDSIEFHTLKPMPPGTVVAPPPPAAAPAPPAATPKPAAAAPAPAAPASPNPGPAAPAAPAAPKAATAPAPAAAPAAPAAAAPPAAPKVPAAAAAPKAAAPAPAVPAAPAPATPKPATPPAK